MGSLHGGAQPAGRLTASRLLLAAAALLAAPAVATATITLTLHSIAGGVSMSGSGGNSGTLAFGTVSVYGAVASGVTRTTTANDYTLSTPFGVHVTKGPISVLSPSYTLQARLQLANGLTWRVGGVTMSTTYATVATSQAYDSTVSHTVAFVVPFTHPAGNIQATLDVLAIAN